MNITKDHLPWSTKNYMLNYLWICPECCGVNAWSYDDAERAMRKFKHIKSSSRTALTVEVKVSHGSCFDNCCGHCGRDIVKPDSPILAECYTHESR